ncbi:MAG: hypothetical protein LUG93_17720 [Lachnospiraceae bacterium]|nr:hypothetical protein [Lachnospiraceae bacterium]
MKNKKIYDDDDGRTIADMSQVERPGMFGHLPRSFSDRQKGHTDSGRNASPRTAHDGADGLEQPPFSRMERMKYTWMALRAGLLVALVYILGCGLVIALLYLFWMVLA